MALLYWTSDIKKLIDDKLKADSAAIVLDNDISDEKRNRFVQELRIFRKYAEELIEDMEELDAEDDRAKAERDARRRAEKEDGTGDQ